MGFFLNLLMLPMLGGPMLVHWVARTIVEEADREALDEDRVRGELLELQEQYDAGAVEEEEYDHQEKVLLERLNAIREIKAQGGG
ncbi:MAG: gas vesicle protein GvpG [Chloroflexota bacterium]